MNTNWRVRDSAVEWVARFFGATRPVKVVLWPGRMPNNALGGLTTRPDLHLIAVRRDLSQWMANYVLAHELVHVRQVEKLGEVEYLATYARFERDLGYRNNPYETEARTKGNIMAGRGSLVVAT